VVQCGDGARLLFEPGAAAGIGRDVGRENLDGHVASQAGIAGAVDFAHRPGAQPGKDFIRAETR
jgi:hypothetical protein